LEEVVQQYGHKPASDSGDSKLQLHLLGRVNIKLLRKGLLLAWETVLLETRHALEPVD